MSQCPRKPYTYRDPTTPALTAQQRSAATYADPEGKARQKEYVARYSKTEKGRASARRANQKYRQTERGHEKQLAQDRIQNEKRRQKKLMAALELERGPVTD